MVENSTRTLRTRRVVALMAWAGLLITAYWLADARYAGITRLSTPPPLAFVLSTFTAFVGVFAWMLYNPARRSAVESPTLSLAAAATLFPPPIIGFCLLSQDSPLRGWLALGLFLLIVIAILSHVPDEFFGVPRNRYSYFVPIPAFDGVTDEALDPDAAWFRSSDLSAVVPDMERPSLAPKAYLQTNPERTRPQKADIRPPSDVDDILSSELDVSLLDDPLWDLNDARPGGRTFEEAGSGARPSARVKTEPGRPDAGRIDQRTRPAQRPEAPSNQPSPSERVRTTWPGMTTPLSVPVVDDQADAEALVDSDASDQTLAVSRADLFRAADDGADNAPESTDRTGSADANQFDKSEAYDTDAEEDSFTLPKSASLLAAPPRHSEADETSQVTLPAKPFRDAGPARTHAKSQPELQRTIEESGAEIVEGVMTVRFDKGQKRANLHVPFSPPLARAPEVECECVGSEQLRLKVPVRQAYGIRIEARRSNAENALETEVGFSAITPAE